MLTGTHQCYSFASSCFLHVQLTVWYGEHTYSSDEYISMHTAAKAKPVTAFPVQALQ